MSFRLVVVGWQCRPYVAQTLASILRQDHDDWTAHVVVDLSDDGTAKEVQRYLTRHPDPRISASYMTERTYAVGTQRHAIAQLDPNNYDVIVWLDLDGDRFAHRSVLTRLAEVYSDPEVMLTYGSYRPHPEPATDWPKARPFPLTTIYENSYRRAIAEGCFFNHLRTMRGRIVKAIPEDHFYWSKLSHEPYTGGTDFLFMTAGLELAGGRHRFIPEVLVHYEHSSPMADNKVRAGSARSASRDYLRRHKPLEPLDGLAHPPPYLPPEQRRQILASYAKVYSLETFVESGTSDGGTAEFMAGRVGAVFTIELDRRAFETARRRFRRDPKTAHVQCVRGDSGAMLPKILGSFAGPALVWLDGHHCGGGSPGRGENPVRAELAALFADGRPHVILVDDARLFGGGSEHDLVPHAADWPSLDWIRETADAAGYSYEMDGDIIRLLPDGVGCWRT